MPVSQRFFGYASLAMLAMGFAVLVALAGTAVWLTQRSRDEADWVHHTLRVQATVSDFSALLERAEASRRGYLLTADPSYIATARDAIHALQGPLAELPGLVKDNPIEGDRAARITALAKQRVTSIERTLAFPPDEIAAARQAFGVATGTSLESLRSLGADMMTEENRLLDGRNAAAGFSLKALVAVAIVGTVVILLLGVGSVLLVRSYVEALRRARVDLEALNEGLEEAVKERTADVLHANHEIQRFAYVVSHDLRAPLVNIMGFTSELGIGLDEVRKVLAEARTAPEEEVAAARQVVEEDWPEALGFIRTSSEKMDRLINAILRLSREGRRSFTAEPLRTTAIVEAIVDANRHRIDERGASIRVEELPNIESDRLAFEQVMGNLVDNAIKYLDHDRPGEIVVGGADLGRRVEYTVTDNGRGIDPRDHERIFDLFRRAGPQDQPGEGIGLTYVQALVRRLGGTIACISELGRGSTFRVVLPKYLPKGILE
jgi:signal transduction histidine kinase